MTRVTVVFTDTRFSDQSEASDWMRRAARDEARRSALLRDATSLLNRAIHAVAVASADPYLAERSPAQALAGRIGHGLGPELADGRFSEVLEIPTTHSRRRRRTDQVGPLEQVAAILSGRRSADVCETFLLRARADLDAGREREAAIGLAIALDSLLVELGDALAGADHKSDLALVRANKADLATIGSRARLGAIDSADTARIADMLAVCERVLRRRQLLRG